MVQFKVFLHFNQPVHQDSPHVSVNLRLLVQVRRKYVQFLDCEKPQNSSWTYEVATFELNVIFHNSIIDIKENFKLQRKTNFRLKSKTRPRIYKSWDSQKVQDLARYVDKYSFKLSCWASDIFTVDKIFRKLKFNKIKHWKCHVIFEREKSDNCIKNSGQRT